MKIRRISLSKATLARMSSDARSFFLLAGHMQNEINSLNKVFAWCLTTEPSRNLTEMEKLANGLQAQLYARLLAGKLFEARAVLDKAYFPKNFHRDVDAKLRPDAKAGIQKIKTYFNNGSAIGKALRDSFSFHYDIKAIASHWNETEDQSDFELVLGGTVGNNLYLGSELFLNDALLRAINSDGGSIALQTFLDDVQSVATWFTVFLEGAIVAILEEATGSSILSQGSEEEITQPLSFDEIKIPHFYDHGLSE